jgi:dolichol-phosphate mannosyltransferase
MSNPILKQAHTTLFVCLPCYNEAQNISKLLPQIHSTLTSLQETTMPKQPSSGSANYQIIAVNDGSTDHTGELLKDYAKTFPLTVVTHWQNQGLAETIRTLIKTLREQAHDGDIAVFMDADNTHPPQIIPDMVKLVSTTADVVVASRFKAGREVKVPITRRIMSKAVNWLLRNFCRIPILDCTSGFRAYRVEVLKALPSLESKGFEITAEILIGISAHRPPFEIREVPLTLRYDRKKGVSKIHVRHTISAYVKLLWKYCRINFTPFVRRIAYKINYKLGKTYDRDPTFWNDGMMALICLIGSFFIYDSLTGTLSQTLRLLSYISVSFMFFCIQHCLRRFWVFKNESEETVQPI